MSVTKMKAVTITGKIEEFDDIVERYVYGRDIHLEKAMSVLTNKGRLQEFGETNEYDTVARDALAIINFAGYVPDQRIIAPEGTRLEEMRGFIDRINDLINEEKSKSDTLSAQIKANEKTMEELSLMASIDADLSKITSLEFIRCRFGRIPKSGYRTLTTYLDDMEAFFIKTAENESDIWGFYFVPLLREQKVEDVMSSLYFEAVDIPAGYSGTPNEIKKQLERKNVELIGAIDALGKKTAKALAEHCDRLIAIYNLAKKRHQLSEVRRNAVHGDMFFYIVGWMDVKGARALEKEIAKSSDTVMFYCEDAETVKDIEPPTKLKNNPVFKPFEMFVRMYGLPSYNELDPTPILAITYILFFGIMFGDVGQAAVLSIAGFLLYKLKKWDLGGIIGWVGLSGIIFGFVYGSFFGNEEIIPRLFNITPIHPMQQAVMMLAVTVGMGVLIIIFGIVLSIINSVKSHDIGGALFGHNGIAGLVFYLGVLLMAGNMFLKWGISPTLFTVLIIASLLCMYLGEPLGKLIEGKKDWLPKDGMFFVENLFEMFEVVLSFFTNTISFLRIGAFAIVHVGMMMVVAILSQSGGVGGAIVQVLGNVIVMILEGLIVGIQVLRLEYYEMFSRYFTGRGREFMSLRDK